MKQPSYILKLSCSFFSNMFMWKLHLTIFAFPAYNLIWSWYAIIENEILLKIQMKTILF